MKPRFSLTAKQLVALLGAFFVSACPATAQPGPLDPIEKQLVEQIDRDQAEAQALLKKVVNINSGTMNFAGVRQVGEIFSRQLEALGFDTQWIDGKAFDRAGHLFASRHAGQNPQGTKILMIGHLDTVFSKDSPIRQMIEVDKQFVKGPGIIDMKGGNVIIVHALKALKAVGVLAKLNIQVVLMGDEEKRGRPIRLSTRVLTDSAKWADIALGYENGDGDAQTAVVSRRGYTGWQLSVSGKAAHSSQIFRDDIGYGAIYEAARILDGFRTTLSSRPNLTFNPGRIAGGTEASLDEPSASGKAFGKDNVIAQITRVSGDLRTLSAQQLHQARQAMQDIVRQNLPHTQATLSFESSYPPMEPSEGNYRLLSLYDQASQDLGFGEVTAVNPRRAGAADISFTAGHVKMAIDGLGLMGHSGHTDNETADMTTLHSQTKRSAVLLYRLAR